MSNDYLSDEVLRQIAGSSGRTYPHEGRAMAREILEWRAKREAAPPPAPTYHNPYGGTPPP